MKKIEFCTILQILTKDHSLKKICQECGISESTFQGWLNGKSPTLKQIENLANLAGYFNVDLEYLLRGQIGSSKSKVVFSSSFEIDKNTYSLIIYKKDDE